MLPRLALSMTSFLPLYSLIVFMYSYVYLYGDICQDTKRYIIIGVITIIAMQFTCALIVNNYIKSKESSVVQENEIIFKNIKEDKKAYVNYMMTYLLPLLAFDLDKVQGFYILYTNILIVVFIIMNARAENFNFNIFLWLKGYYVYKGINSDEYEKTLLIKKKRFSNIRTAHSKYKFVSFGGGNDIYLCKRYSE